MVPDAGNRASSAALSANCHQVLGSPCCASSAPQAGVNADAISHDDYFNAPGDSYKLKLDTAGSYSYYCEPHQGAGMVGKITVQ